MGVIKKGGITFAGVSTLQELQDVTIDTLTLSNGQILKYNALNDKWENKDGSIQLSELKDIDFSTSPVDGNTLVYDETNDVWIPGAGSGGGALVIPQKLTAGQTSITFSNAAILATSFISVASEAWYTDAEQTTGSVTLTFPAQASDMLVQIMVAN